MRRLGFRLLLCGVACGIALYLAEGVLALGGYGREIPRQVANPPNYRMDVRNHEFRYVWETNDRGIRYRNVPLRKPRNTRRVFVVGDSFTDGEGVATELRFSDLLERRFDRADRPVQFVNGGLGGQGVLQYSRLFHWLGKSYQPDGLLICINANDLGDLEPGSSPRDVYDIVRLPDGAVSGAFHRLWPRLWGRLVLALDRTSSAEDPYGPEGFDVDLAAAEARRRGLSAQRIRSWRERIPDEWAALAAQDRIAPYLLTWGLFRPWFYDLALDVRGPDAESRWSSMSSILDDMIAGARDAGIAPAAVFLPGRYLYDARSHDAQARAPFHYLGGHVRPEWVREETEIQRRLRGWAGANDVPYLDLTQAFRGAAGRGEQLHYAIDGHWNEHGHRVAAAALEDWLGNPAVFPFLD